MHRPKHVLPIIIVAQFAGTSLWFAGNAILDDLSADWGLVGLSVSNMTNAVQFGFIAGTLLFALTAISDRFPARFVFCICALAGAASTAALMVIPESMFLLLSLRFLTGFFLAGIYPVGMKIAAQWFDRGLGRALGYLVGALVLGTAFPHFVHSIGIQLHWQSVVITLSSLAAMGGLAMVIFVKDGPFVGKPSAFAMGVFLTVFKNKPFRRSALGYFGHMWELYALWAFLPMWLLAYKTQVYPQMNVGLWAFFVIAAGALGCVFGGYVSQLVGSRKVAMFYLCVSAMCCLLSPLFFNSLPVVLGVFLFVWGVAVVGDSPQLSALNADNAPKEYLGSALTLTNCIGFFIATVSVFVLEWSRPMIDPGYLFWLLLPGPILGLMALTKGAES